MKLLDYLRYPVSPRQMGIWFMLGGVGFILLSAIAPTNFRQDWLDPQWWVRILGAAIFFVGLIFVVVPTARWYR
jgi:hypothetical protein